MVRQQSVVGLRSLPERVFELTAEHSNGQARHREHRSLEVAFLAAEPRVAVIAGRSYRRLRISLRKPRPPANNRTAANTIPNTWPVWYAELPCVPLPARRCSCSFRR